MDKKTIRQKRQYKHMLNIEIHVELFHIPLAAAQLHFLLNSGIKRI